MLSTLSNTSTKPPVAGTTPTSSWTASSTSKPVTTEEEEDKLPYSSRTETDVATTSASATSALPPRSSSLPATSSTSLPRDRLTSLRPPLLPLTPSSILGTSAGTPSSASVATPATELKQQVQHLQQRPRDIATPREIRLPPIHSPKMSMAGKAQQAEELAARLALLLHARSCVDPTCKLENCSTARGVLDHCQECCMAYGTCHSSCGQAKALLRHFRICRAKGFRRPCLVCGILRKDYPWALQAASNLSPIHIAENGYSQNQVQPSNMRSPTNSNTSSNSSYTQSPPSAAVSSSTDQEPVVKKQKVEANKQSPVKKEELKAPLKTETPISSTQDSPQ